MRRARLTTAPMSGWEPTVARVINISRCGSGVVRCGQSQSVDRGLAERIKVNGCIASIYAQRLAGYHDRSLGSVGKSAECCTASSEVARHIDNWYPGIANTIVQLFRFDASVLM